MMSHVHLRENTVSPSNRQFRLAARPTGLPDRETWSMTDEPIGDPGPGEVAVQVLYLSLDPAMRAWLDEGPSYIPAVEVGEVMRAMGLGRVIASADESFGDGDVVSGIFGIQEYAVMPARGLQKVDASVEPLTVHLNTLGIPGLTAYFGLLDVGRPQEGDTVVVSGAAGAVGATAGQIARLKGCRAVGIAGGPEKCELLTEVYGYDAAIDYKSDDVRQALREHCPDGIGVYFDNVGGPILEAALARLARGARVVLCGAVSQYNSGAMQGPRNYMSLLINRASMTGFVIFDYADRYGEAARELGGWLKEGRLVSREDVVDGIETFPETLNMLFTGANTGKLVLKVAE
jgi:NADPH-dependent curcumin reductase CurA